MKIGILIIGTEIQTAKIVDTNGPWIIEKMTRNGHAVVATYQITDDWISFEKSLKTLSSICDVLILSGGLGPTKDDLTKEFLARYFNKKIIENEQALKMANRTYQRFNREYSESVAGYHKIPEDFYCLDNPKGFAPPLAYETNDLKVFALPGVPRELQAIIDEEIVPRLSDKNHEKIMRIQYRTKLIPEEKIFFHIMPTLWSEFEKFGKAYSLPHTMGVDLGVLTTERQYSEAKEYLDNIVLNSPLKDSIWEIGDESLESKIIKLAQTKSVTIATAESCTGGMVGHRLTNISGSSHAFLGGIISYSNEVKSKILKVSDSTLSTAGAVSIETAEEMAEGCYNQLGADISISLTGIAGPSGGSENKPVGTVCIAVYVKHKGIVSNERYQFLGDREKLKERFSQMGLYLILESIEKYF